MVRVNRIAGGVTAIPGGLINTGNGAVTGGVIIGGGGAITRRPPLLDETAPQVAVLPEPERP